MKNKRLLTLENSNSDFVPSQQSDPTSKKTRISPSPARVLEDFDGIYYSNDNEDSPMEDPVSIIFCFFTCHSMFQHSNWKAQWEYMRRGE